MFNAFICRIFSLLTAVVCFFSNLTYLPAAEKIIFSAIGENNESIWGVKK